MREEDTSFVSKEVKKLIIFTRKRNSWRKRALSNHPYFYSLSRVINVSFFDFRRIVLKTWQRNTQFKEHKGMQLVCTSQI